MFRIFGGVSLLCRKMITKREAHVRNSNKIVHPNNMQKIIIVRTNQWFSQAKNIYVYINDEKVGVIAPGEIVQFEVSAGKNTVVVRNNWIGGSNTLVVDVKKNEDKIIRMSSPTYTFYITVAAAVFLANSLHEYRNNGQLNWSNGMISNPLILLLITILLIVLFMLTLYRRYYFKLEEAQEVSDGVKAGQVG